MTQSQSSYRQIFKATSLFGGVQVFNILVGIVRVKFVAVLLGTAGVGIMGLLNAPLNLIVSVTGLGIAMTGVKDVAEAHCSGDSGRMARVAVTLRRWSWLTGIAGSVITASLAPMLSQWTFGNSDYTWSFVWLSLTLLLQAISKGQSALLQGVRRLKDMAKAGAMGSLLGLVTSVPLYYWFGLKGIVPAMIVTAVTTLFLSSYFSRKIIIEKTEMTCRQTYNSGLGMVKLGISMTVAGFIASLSTYILNALISNRGGVSEVGLYNAGWGVVGQYTSLIFAAMATDYFPRLSAINTDNVKVKELVSQQAETAFLIMTPLLSLLIVFMPVVVRILYTPEFIPMVMFANLTLVGMQFKAMSWAMGYVYLAKGDGKLFLTMEVVAGGLILMINVALYLLLGLNGLGASFIISYFLGMAFSAIVLKRKYSVTFSNTLYLRLIITSGLVILTFLTTLLHVQLLKYITGILCVAIVSLYCLSKLNELMDLKELIKSRLSR